MSSQYPLEFIMHGSGFRVNEVAGENLGNHKLVYRNPLGTWSLADASLAATMPVLGITMGAVTTGKYGEILRLGYIGDSAWTWTPGGEVYASDTVGELTQVAGTVSQIVGMAVTATMIWFNSNMGNGGGVSASTIVTIPAQATQASWNHARNTLNFSCVPLEEPESFWWGDPTDANNITIHIASMDIMNDHTFRVMVF